LLAPQIWISNFVEDFASKRRHSTPGAVVTSITTQIRLPEFPWDDGTVEFAKAGGMYVADEVEAPVAEDRLVAPSIANPPGTTVILTFGQSNAANSGEERYAARGQVHVFNIFDMRFYRAIDPLPGASHDGGSAWGRLGDMLSEVREAGVDAPIYVALATLCEEAPHPFQSRAEIRRGQRKLISIRDRILPGPDTDVIGIDHRRDGCHFAASGQQLGAQAWI